jgi:cytochrome c oxidase subunit 2
MDDGDYVHKVLFLPDQASSVAKEIDWLHFAVISATMLGATVITLVAAYFCVRYRMRRPRQPNERRSPAPTPPLWAELLLIGGLFSLFVAFWGIGFWQYVKLAEPPANSYDIYVSAKQWMWKFAYPSGQHTVNTLYAPAGRPVRLILTSRDVIHSFYVPDFRIKHDAVPGRYTSLWFTANAPGTHPILCAEYCGTDHSRMRGAVVALSEADFSRWLDSESGGEVAEGEDSMRDTAPPGLAGHGEVVAAKYGCLRCHSIDGSPHIGPTWKGLYGASVPLTDGSSTLADVAYLTESMMDPLAKLHRGYGGVMPSYQGYLQPAEVSAIVEFMKTLRANSPPPAAPLGHPDGGVYPIPERAGQTGQPPEHTGQESRP